MILVDGSETHLHGSDVTDAEPRNLGIRKGEYLGFEEFTQTQLYRNRYQF